MFFKRYSQMADRYNITFYVIFRHINGDHYNLHVNYSELYKNMYRLRGKQLFLSRFSIKSSCLEREIWFGAAGWLSNLEQILLPIRRIRANLGKFLRGIFTSDRVYSDTSVFVARHRFIRAESLEAESIRLSYQAVAFLFSRARASEQNGNNKMRLKPARARPRFHSRNTVSISSCTCIIHNSQRAFRLPRGGEVFAFPCVTRARATWKNSRVRVLSQVPNVAVAVAEWKP